MPIFIAGWAAARRLTWIGLAGVRCSRATRAVRILMVEAVRRGTCSLLAATIAPVSPSTARYEAGAWVEGGGGPAAAAGGAEQRATVARTVRARRARHAPPPRPRNGDWRGPARRIRV